MLDTIKLKYYQGDKYIKDIQNAPIKDSFRGFPIIKEGEIDVSCCPLNALSTNPNKIDMGKCTFCAKCKSEIIQFSPKYKISSASRENLIIKENMTFEEFEKTAIKARKEIKKIFSKSLKLRQVSAGGCNGCEMELNACLNANFDMGRFGIEFTASPRHADGLVITGPITKNMAYALEDCYQSTPNPKIVILAGACAISGGIFQNSDMLNREFIEKYNIDLYIPGCPIHPLTFINALLDYLEIKA
ncbi:MAG: hypothetical protein IJ877_01295 [Candidatus Gastranaerophilales bacterium]|nr:hypothetical protein [Candidatus Gastranaerophilales bacterium]